MRELPLVLDEAAPFMMLGYHFWKEALCFWLNSCSFIMEGFLPELDVVDANLFPHGIDVYEEIRKVEIWAWERYVLVEAAFELQPLRGLRVLKVLLGDRVDMSEKTALRLLQGLHGPLQVKFYREEEHVENEEPACKKVVNIPATEDWEMT